MTDQLEAALRDEFETVAAAAGLGADRAGAWVGTARARAGARRRRTALVAGAGVAVLAVAVPFAVLGRDRHDPAPAPATPEPSTSPEATSPPETTFDPAVDGVLHLRGVTVRVPKAMLDPGNRRCGTSLVDAAWWEDRHTGTRLCLVEAPTSSLTEVTLRAPGPDEPVDAARRKRVLEDGRTAISVGFPDRHVVLRVISPQPGRVERLAASARQVPEDGEVLGCVVRDPGRPRTTGRQTDRIAPEPAVAGVVCGYRDGWLVDAHPLGEAGATELAERFNEAPPMISRDRLDCASFTLRTGAWAVGLVGQGGLQTWLRVEPAACPEPGVMSDQGFEAATTGDLVDALKGYAQGPIYHWQGEKPESSQRP